MVHKPTTLTLYTETMTAGNVVTTFVMEKRPEKNCAHTPRARVTWFFVWVKTENMAFFVCVSVPTPGSNFHNSLETCGIWSVSYSGKDQASLVCSHPHGVVRGGVGQGWRDSPGWLHWQTSESAAQAPWPEQATPLASQTGQGFGYGWVWIIQKSTDRDSGTLPKCNQN